MGERQSDSWGGGGCFKGGAHSRQTKGEEGEMMMMSVDRQGELNLLIFQSGKKATRGICDWISFKSTSRSIELALLISKGGGWTVRQKFCVDTVCIIHLSFLQKKGREDRQDEAGRV